MRPNWGRVLRRAAAAGIPLAIIGYMLGRGFLFFHRVYAGGGFDPQNERVLWQTPLVMATLGVVLAGGMDLLFQLVRRPSPVPVLDAPTET
jgi:hypothetical protein